MATDKQVVTELQAKYGSDTLEILKLQNKALRAFPSSPRQKAIQAKIAELIDKHS